jgi:hypothetical protein
MQYLLQRTRIEGRKVGDKDTKFKSSLTKLSVELRNEKKLKIQCPLIMLSSSPRLAPVLFHQIIFNEN